MSNIVIGRLKVCGFDVRMTQPGNQRMSDVIRRVVTGAMEDKAVRQCQITSVFCDHDRLHGNIEASPDQNIMAYPFKIGLEEFMGSGPDHEIT